MSLNARRKLQEDAFCSSPLLGRFVQELPLVFRREVAQHLNYTDLRQLGTVLPRHMVSTALPWIPPPSTRTWAQRRFDLVEDIYLNNDVMIDYDDEYDFERKTGFSYGKKERHALERYVGWVQKSSNGKPVRYCKRCSSRFGEIQCMMSIEATYNHANNQVCTTRHAKNARFLEEMRNAIEPFLQE